MKALQAHRMVARYKNKKLSFFALLYWKLLSINISLQLFQNIIVFAENICNVSDNLPVTKQARQKVALKLDSPLPKKNCVIGSIESSLKIMKNAFYFILKALFVLKIFQFLSWFLFM